MVRRTILVTCGVSTDMAGPGIGFPGGGFGFLEGDDTRRRPSLGIPTSEASKLAATKAKRRRGRTSATLLGQRDDSDRAELGQTVLGSLGLLGS